jgi:hypothetical protein
MAANHGGDQTILTQPHHTLKPRDTGNPTEELAARIAREAGIIKVPTPLDFLRRAWSKASEEEKQQFLAEIQEG